MVTGQRQLKKKQKKTVKVGCALQLQGSKQLGWNSLSGLHALLWVCVSEVRYSPTSRSMCPHCYFIGGVAFPKRCMERLWTISTNSHYSCHYFNQIKEIIVLGVLQLISLLAKRKTHTDRVLNEKRIHYEISSLSLADFLDLVF